MFAETEITKVGAGFDFTLFRVYTRNEVSQMMCQIFAD